MGLLVICAATCRTALAVGNPLGFYTGIGLGVRLPQSDQGTGLSAEHFSPSSTLGWDAFVGIRPIRWLGAELQYMDFGHSSRSARSCYSGPCFTPGLIFTPPLYRSSTQGGHLFAGAAFAVVYPPLPFIPSWIDLFGKVGRAWLWAPYTTDTPIPGLGFTFSNGVSGNETSDLAYGGGMQVHFGAFGFRTEYQVIDDAVVGNPSLLTVEVTWTP